MTTRFRWSRDIGVSLGIMVSRLLELMPNFSPLGSWGFFGGNLVVFLASVIVFDLLKGGLYKGFWLTYLGFVGYWVLGRVATTLNRKIVLLPAASLVFFLLSNFGVWWYWFPHTFEDLVRCYILALPFYQNTFVSDLLFGYGYLALQSKVKVGYNRLDAPDSRRHALLPHLSASLARR
jgi:hypothetical protein